MENDIKAQENQENPTFSVEKKNSNIGIFWVRLLACMAVLFVIILIKFNNRCMYDGIKFWYQNNFGVETISSLEIKEKAQKLILPILEKIKNS